MLFVISYQLLVIGYSLKDNGLKVKILFLQITKGRIIKLAL
jgi:hypothetical protein